MCQACNAVEFAVQNLVVAHMAIAKKCNPGLSERFNLFCKSREHSQASESDNSGEGAKDLVSIVEVQVISPNPVDSCCAKHSTVSATIHFVHTSACLQTNHKNAAGSPQ